MTKPDEPEGHSPDGRPTLIAIVYSLPEARVLECTLRAYGIVAFAFDYWTVAICPPWMVALGGIRVVVPAHQREDAIALLYEIDEGWTAPPRAFARNAGLNIILTIICGFVLGITPMPRVRGLYAWRRRQAESGSPAL
jgi:hypothetical protein